jgi:hypothetical protein
LSDGLTNFRFDPCFAASLARIGKSTLRRMKHLPIPGQGRYAATWRKLMRIAERWLPSPKLRHPYPDGRSEVMTRGGSPVG